MKNSEIKKMKDEELTTLISEQREALRSFRFGNNAGDAKVKYTAELAIARALTELQVRSRATGEEA